MKKVLLLLTTSLATFAQTTYTYEGGGCGTNYFCRISPSNDVDAPWGATAPINGGTPGAKYTVITGLNVTLEAYRSFAAIPEHLVSSGTGMFAWYDGLGNGDGHTGSFTLPVNCTWDYTPIPNPILPNNPIREFTEVCTAAPDPNGSAEAVTFTRHWVANPGRYGYWYITRLVNGGLGAGSIVDTSTLTN